LERGHRNEAAEKRYSVQDKRNASYTDLGASDYDRGTRPETSTDKILGGILMAPEPADLTILHRGTAGPG